MYYYLYISNTLYIFLGAVNEMFGWVQSITGDDDNFAVQNRDDSD